VTVRPGFPPARAYAARLGRDLALEEAGPGTWRVTVPEVALFELLALEGAAEGAVR
jgi:hypothetical protein